MYIINARSDLSSAAAAAAAAVVRSVSLIVVRARAPPTRPPARLSREFCVKLNYYVILKKKENPHDDFPTPFT